MIPEYRKSSENSVKDCNNSTQAEHKSQPQYILNTFYLLCESPVQQKLYANLPIA